MLKQIFTYLKKNHFYYELASVAMFGITMLYRAIELKIWNVSVDFIDGMRSQALLIVIICIFYCLSLAIIQEYIHKKSTEDVPFFLSFKYMLTLSKKLIKAEKKLNKNFKKLIKEKGQHIPKKDIQSAEKKLSALEDDLTSLKKDFYEKTWRIIKALLLYIAASIVIHIAPFFLLYIIVFNTSLATTAIYYCISMISILATTYYFTGKETRKRIRSYNKAIKTDKNNLYLYVDICRKTLSDEDKRIANLIKTKESSNADYKEYLLSALSMFILLIGVRLCSIPKSFWVYTDEANNNYTVILETDDGIVAKKADINKDQITIHLNDQLYLSLSNLQTKYMTFNTVLKQD